KVEAAHCTCKAGVGETCTHVTALLFNVEATVRICGTRSVTDEPAHWVLLGNMTKIQKVLSDSNMLSEKLQSKTVDLSKAINLVESLKKTMVYYQTESFFDDLGISTQHIPKQSIQKARKLHDSLVNSTLGQHVDPDSKQMFRIQVFYPVIDCMMGEMERRFSRLNCNIMKGIQALNPSSGTFLREEDVLFLARAYDSNTDDLKHEVPQIRRVLERLAKSDETVPTTLLKFVSFLESYNDVFFELFRLCKIAVVLPVSSASCERTFFALRIIKNYLRSTMTEERLSNLSILTKKNCVAVVIAGMLRTAGSSEKIISR
uniref:HAT C-terminal dimerisation domain-containing protein n=1 Tax=Maylandia zebra TaxID=106582 RepID=A0A3P9BEC3_9CICH